ncbi:hypothetical protein EA472_14445 [Natrarchaeobius oligotrophus]|uniref:Uncharacterized protein n=1 Tax=Natrarchaeobius chitinivorans TaxID=1679083 RepID=A0A3N6MSW2_NATCH|nr:hypothetical protein EA472_14445 [Natrarchaeobius chitinivorans]
MFVRGEVAIGERERTPQPRAPARSVGVDRGPLASNPLRRRLIRTQAIPHAQMATGRTLIARLVVESGVSLVASLGTLSS